MTTPLNLTAAPQSSYVVQQQPWPLPQQVPSHQVPLQQQPLQSIQFSIPDDKYKPLQQSARRLPTHVELALAGGHVAASRASTGYVPTVASNFAGTGVRTNETGNAYTFNPFTTSQSNYFQSTVELPVASTNATTATAVLSVPTYETYHAIDLNLDNYTNKQLFELFGLASNELLTKEKMKQAKTIANKSHPDKSRMDNKFYQFFSRAYNKLYEIYQYQSRFNVDGKAEPISSKAANYDPNVGTIDLFADESNQKLVLQHFGTGNSFDQKKFNEEFNRQKLEDPNEAGYSDWLKSEDDIAFGVNKHNFNEYLAKRKALMVYNGVQETTYTGGYNLLDTSKNFSSTALWSSEGMNFTDLKAAYTDNFFSATAEEAAEAEGRRATLESYKQQRDTMDITPIDKSQSEELLKAKHYAGLEQSMNIFDQLNQREREAQQRQNEFLSKLKHITY